MSNENEYRGGRNSDKVFELEIDDDEEHHLPDTEAGDGFHGRRYRHHVAKIVNDTDTNLDAWLQGATGEDPDFEEPVTFDEATNIDSGGGVLALTANPDAPLRWYRVLVQLNNEPGEPGTVKAVFQSGNS